MSWLEERSERLSAPNKNGRITYKYRRSHFRKRLLGRIGGHGEKLRGTANDRGVRGV